MSSSRQTLHGAVLAAIKAGRELSTDEAVRRLSVVTPSADIPRIAKAATRRATPARLFSAAAKAWAVEQVIIGVKEARRLTSRAASERHRRRREKNASKKEKNASEETTREKDEKNLKARKKEKKVSEETAGEEEKEPSETQASEKEKEASEKKASEKKASEKVTTPKKRRCRQLHKATTPPEDVTPESTPEKAVDDAVVRSPKKRKLAQAGNLLLSQYFFERKRSEGRGPVTLAATAPPADAAPTSPAVAVSTDSNATAAYGSEWGAHILTDE